MIFCGSCVWSNLDVDVDVVLTFKKMTSGERDVTYHRVTQGDNDSKASPCHRTPNRCLSLSVHSSVYPAHGSPRTRPVTLNRLHTTFFFVLPSLLNS